MLAQKHLFSTPKLDLDVGESIPATVGYETYGQLSPGRDNAILICHPWGGSSHAAGRYHPDDREAGWWDPLIGPGKAFDTNRHYIIAIDSLCSLSPRNPMVVTTGPSSLNAETGMAYGPAFPQVTIRDQVRLQYQVLQSLGIQRLAAVAGPGMGGFQALEWAVTYPHMVGKVIAAASAHAAPPVFSLAVCHAGIEAIRQDAETGLGRAVELFLTLSRSDSWIGGTWERQTAAGSVHPWADKSGRYAFQREMEQMARQQAQLFDPEHYMYTARACMLHDIGHGNRGLEVAAQKIKAELLILPITSDLLFPPETARPLVDLVNQYGGRAEIHPVESPNGHMAAVYESNRFIEPIARFMSRGELH